MFGLTKILLLVLVVVGTWYVSKITAVGARRRRAEERRAASGRATQTTIDAEEMVQCRLCGTYLLASSPAACARDDCPYRHRT